MGGAERATRDGTSLGALRRRALLTLAQLRLPTPYTITDLHQAVERVHGRPIVLVPRPMPWVRLHGVWIADSERDYVFYPAGTTPLHRWAILAHEFWHILNDDCSSDEQLRRAAARLLPDIDPSRITGVAARTTFTDEAEQHAELFATVVVAGLGPWSALPTKAANLEVQKRITSTLGASADG